MHNREYTLVEVAQRGIADSTMSFVHHGSQGLLGARVRTVHWTSCAARATGSRCSLDPGSLAQTLLRQLRSNRSGFKSTEFIKTLRTDGRPTRAMGTEVGIQWLATLEGQAPRREWVRSPRRASSRNTVCAIAGPLAHSHHTLSRATSVDSATNSWSPHDIAFMNKRACG